MKMDRADIVGLSVAIGGHAILLGMLAFGLFASEEKIEKPSAIAVTLEGQGSPLPVTGDVGELEPAEVEAEDLPTPDIAEASEELDDEADDKADAAAAAEAKARRAREAADASNATAIQKKRAREAEAAAAKKRKEAKAAEARRKKAAEDARRKKAEAQRKTEEKRKKAAAAAAKRKKDFEDKMNKQLGGGGNASATTGQARSAANASIGSEVRPFVQRNCKLSAGDNSSLRVFVSLTISQSGALRSSRVYDVKGVTPQNQTQVGPAKQCVLQSLKQASPYSLNSADYNVWKNHKVQVKVNLR